MRGVSGRLVALEAPTVDAELFRWERRIASGECVVYGPDAPLELNDPAHLEAPLRVYKRFQEIGVLAAP
jgi:hypothetical protein